jgi:hypothetical protein
MIKNLCVFENGKYFCGAFNEGDNVPVQASCMFFNTFGDYDEPDCKYSNWEGCCTDIEAIEATITATKNQNNN